MIDLVAVKKAIKTGELTVYQSGDYVYMENKAGEKIVLMKKAGELKWQLKATPQRNTP